MTVTEGIEGRELSTIRMGGPLGRLMETGDPRELGEALARLHRDGRPYIVIGSGSNIVFPPTAPSLSVLRFTGNRVRVGDGDSLLVESGCSIARLMGWCFVNGRSGLEFLIGIPGTLGGALAVNAGAFGESIGSRLISAEVMDARGQKRQWSAEEFSFTYRNSRIKYGREIILSACLQAPRSGGDEIGRKMRENIRYRRSNHPDMAPSAGCFFKNPKPGIGGISAGKLIDECGLKGFRQGDLEISPLHANFVLNRGRADQNQLAEFCRHIETVVLNQTGIPLEREVIWIDRDGRKH